MRLFILTLLFSSCAIAGGSIFGTQPTGDPIVSGGVRAVGLCGAGLAIFDSIGMHADNAAATAYMTGAMLRAGMFTGMYNTSEHGKTDSDGEFGWQAFRLYLNIHPRYKMGIGIDPISRTDLRTFNQDSLSFASDSGTAYEKYESRKVWLGSSTNIRWDHAVKVSERFGFGATAAFATSYQEVNHALDFPSTGSSNDARDALFHDVQRYSGFWGGISVIAKPTDKLSVGGFWNSASDGNWGLERAVNHNGEKQFSEVSGSRPGGLGIGVGYRIKHNWAGYADFQQSSWSKKHYGPLYESSVLKDQDAMSVMFGVEKLGGTRITDEGFDRWDYRAGFAFRKQPWQVFSDSASSDVSEVALSLGISLPLAQQAGKLHTALEFGKRTASDVDVSEIFARFYLQLDMHERWFKRERRKLGD